MIKEWILEIFVNIKKVKIIGFFLYYVILIVYVVLV